GPAQDPQRWHPVPGAARAPAARADGRGAGRVAPALREGYASSTDELVRPDVSGEAIRLTRALVALMPDEPEAGGLLALMLLQDARRPARLDAEGELVLLADQDRTLWDRGMIAEGAA